MIWNNFKHLFHESWHLKMQKFIESKDCDEIYAFLKNEVRRGKQIAPLSSNTFRCFLETPLDELKVIMVGLSPYHTFKNNLPVADGLLMGCSVTNYPQPSLDQFYDALEREFYNGLTLHYTKNPNVSYLAHQGVLMLNTSLTCEMNKPGSHLTLWEPFMKYLFQEVLFTEGVPIIFLGNEAGKLEKYVGVLPTTFNPSHPASAAYNHSEWDSQGVFRKVNNLLMKRNGYTINWLDIDESDNLPF